MLFLKLFENDIRVETSVLAYLEYQHVYVVRRYKVLLSIINWNILEENDLNDKIFKRKQKDKGKVSNSWIYKLP